MAHQAHIRTKKQQRRGNAIVLVAGVLALLVVVATAYVTRTQSGRRVASAVRDAELRRPKARIVGETIAAELALRVFVEPINSNPNVAGGVAPGRVAGAESPRLAPGPNATRFGVDANLQQHVNYATSHPYHYAPHWVVPFTNWPDRIWFPDASEAPRGMGNGDGGGYLDTIFAFEGNPIGFPGSGDSRWLADTEPLRWNTNQPLTDYIEGPDALRGWRHLSNLSRVNNGWRICTDISDVFDLRTDEDVNNRLGVLLDASNTGIAGADLNAPVEQWLVMDPQFNGVSLLDPSTGDTFLPDDIADRFASWFFDYANTFSEPDRVPPNFLKLADLNANGIRDFFETGTPYASTGPADEFKEGTARHAISRFLADADGDGYTDSFWFLAPVPTESGTINLVAMRIIDNTSMLNVNTATRFYRNESDLVSETRTVGATPADVALIGQIGTPNYDSADNSWNVGYFDNRQNGEGQFGFELLDPYTADTVVRWTSGRWAEFRRTIGAWDNPAFGPTDPDANGASQFVRQAERIRYWQAKGLQPFTPLLNLRSFSMQDELELRMYSGQNYPYYYSLLEEAIDGPPDSGGASHFLHSYVNFDNIETSEFLGQLRNRELRYDHRKRLTVYNGARNEHMPPWLWRDGTALSPTVPRRKLDLRGTLPPLDSTGFDRDPEILIDTIQDALSDCWEFNGTTWQRCDGMLASGSSQRRVYQNYFGTFIYPPQGGPSNTEQTEGDAARETQLLATAYAANLLDYRDGGPDDQPTILDVPTVGGFGAPVPSGDIPNAFMGMEAQPFIVESFVGHVYEAATVPGQGQHYDPLSPQGPRPWLDAGRIFVHHVDDGGAGSTGNAPCQRNWSTLIAVQLANPFDTPIDLMDFELRVFDKKIHLGAALNLLGGQINPATNAPYVIGYNAAYPTHLLPATEQQVSGGNNARFPSIIIWGLGDIPTQSTQRLREKWEDFLDLEASELPAGTLVLNVRDLEAVGAAADVYEPWVFDDRDAYDTFDGEPIELKRRINLDADPELETITVDRLVEDGSTSDFVEKIQELGTSGKKPEVLADAPNTDETERCDVGAVLLHATHPDPSSRRMTRNLGWIIGNSADANPPNFWVQWVRATRAWGVDVDGNGTYDQHERSPRYVFADLAVTTSFDPPVTAGPAVGASPDYASAGDTLIVDQMIDPDDAGTWFTAQYYPMKPDQGGGLGTPGGGAVGPAPKTFEPTFFDLGGIDENDYFAYPDKGWYGQGDSPSQTEPDNTNVRDFPMQMLIKNADFDQVGELLNVWAYGHALQMPTLAGDIGVDAVKTVRTFSEQLALPSGGYYHDPIRDPVPNGQERFTNRLYAGPNVTDPDITNQPDNLIGGFLTPQLEYGASNWQSIENAPGFVTDPRHAVPAMPAAMRLLDAFVCDGPGLYADALVNGGNNDRIIQPVEWFDHEDRCYYNAAGASRDGPFPVGRNIPGLININTASREVMRALPHMFRNVHEGSSPQVQLVNNPMSRLPDAIVQYRELLGSPDDGNFEAPYGDRGARAVSGALGAGAQPGYVPGLREERGMASPAEVLLLTRGGTTATNATQPDWLFDALLVEGPAGWEGSWAVDNYANLSRFSYNFFTEPSGWPEHQSVQLSTDVNNVTDTYDDNGNGQTDDWVDDIVARDAEEANLLYSGISNLITTRSDVFTVYFKIRTVKQSADGRWNALDRESVIEDSRYVMLVDRSGVNTPSDEAKILYLQKLPN